MIGHGAWANQVSPQALPLIPNILALFLGQGRARNDSIVTHELCCTSLCSSKVQTLVRQTDTPPQSCFLHLCNFTRAHPLVLKVWDAAGIPSHSDDVTEHLCY